MSSDGEVVWSYGRPPELFGGFPESGPPTVDKDGTIFATTLTDSLTATLVALRPDGSVKWKLKGVPAGAPPVIGRDRSLYVGRVAVGER
jgi:outer membrane protein assembly factor BamB